MVDWLRGRHRVETLEQLLQQLRDGRSPPSRPETLFVPTLRVLVHVLHLQLLAETLCQILHVLVHVLRLLQNQAEILGQILHVLVHVLRLLQLQAETLRRAIRLGTQYLSRHYHQVVLCCRQSQAARLCSQC